MLLAATLVAAAKPPRVATQVKTWQMPGLSAVADTTVFMDTLMLNYFDVDVQNNWSISNATNGNILVSPLQSRVINDRIKNVDDPFARSLAPYVVSPQQQRFFNTTTPFSTVAYKKGFVTGHEENDIDFLFTGNLSKALNLGLEMDFLSSVGHYASTSGGGTFAGGEKIRAGNKATWKEIYEITGKPLLADAGYDRGGEGTGHAEIWDNVANINARAADYVLGVMQMDASLDYPATVENLRSQVIVDYPWCK